MPAALRHLYRYNGQFKQQLQTSRVIDTLAQVPNGISNVAASVPAGLLYSTGPATFSSVSVHKARPGHSSST
jgi:hypothetical protein